MAGTQQDRTSMASGGGIPLVNFQKQQLALIAWKTHAKLDVKFVVKNLIVGAGWVDT